MASNVVSDNFETGTGGVPQLGGTGATTCKAWVNFNGTGTVAIRDSYNVSSIADNGTGKYTVNFTSAMGNSDYTTVGGTIGDDNTTGSATQFVGGGSGIPEPTTSAVGFKFIHVNGNSYDVERVNIQVFGD